MVLGITTPLSSGLKVEITNPTWDNTLCDPQIVSASLMFVVPITRDVRHVWELLKIINWYNFHYLPGVLATLCKACSMASYSSEPRCFVWRTFRPWALNTLDSRSRNKKVYNLFYVFTSYVTGASNLKYFKDTSFCWRLHVCGLSQ